MGIEQSTEPVMPEPAITMTHAARVLEADAAGDPERVAALITASPLEAWFGIPPERMHQILREVPPHLVAPDSAVRAFRLFLNGPVAVGSEPLAGSDAAAAFFDARTRGKPREAVSVFRRNSPVERPNALFDETAGIATFHAVQIGLAEMLTGDLVAALDSFTLARRTRPPEQLTALLRDAYVKAAVIQALHGDPRAARRKLDLAAHLPRTGSWVEPVLDAHAQLAEAIMATDADLDDAVERIERIPLPLLGELWPYRVEAVFRLHLRRGRLLEAEASVARFRPAASGFVPGEGVPGSVFATTGATAALLRGDVGRARSLLAEIDRRPAMYRLVHESVAIASGDLGGSINRLVGLHTETAPLRQLEFFRCCLLSAALLARNDVDAAAEILRGTVERPGGLDDSERAFVPESVARFASAAVEEWPEGFGTAGWGAHTSPTLTPREREVLALMATDLSRSQIADHLFVSENTVKSQQRAVFRKLGVTTRVDAILAGQRLGIL